MLELNKSGQITSNGEVLPTTYRHQNIVFDELVPVRRSNCMIAISGDQWYFAYETINNKLDLEEIPRIITSPSRDFVGSGNHIAINNGGQSTIYSPKLTRHIAGDCVYVGNNLMVVSDNEGRVYVNDLQIGKYEKIVFVHYCPASQILRLLDPIEKKIIMCDIRTLTLATKIVKTPIIGDVAHIIFDPREKRIVRIVTQNGNEIINGPVVLNGQFLHGFGNVITYRDPDGKVQYCY